ncbi:MAG: 3'(2'),5'-bisphosphate nucleotidase CysQ [Methylobacterium mesophilicum]|nr:3'(2'),5'-bisphosphate nucleotidase CysQ [Methylobacterium mesophilicum]
MLDRLCALALEAGRAIMAVYEAPRFEHHLKSDASPVTEADTRAEAIILEGLRADYPAIPIVAEEESAAGRVPATAEWFFLVDPLDGTREFLARNGDFTVNIALIENGAPTLGVIFAPASGELFGGASGLGAFRAHVENGRSGPRAAIATRSASPAPVAVASRSHGSAETNEWLKRRSVENYVARGSSLKFCLLAAGEADLYPRFTRTMEWDTAAGDAILRAAGGTVHDLDGRPLRYNKRDQPSDADFANKGFIAYGDPGLAT